MMNCLICRWIEAPSSWIAAPIGQAEFKWQPDWRCVKRFILKYLKTPLDAPSIWLSLKFSLTNWSSNPTWGGMGHFTSQFFTHKSVKVPPRCSADTTSQLRFPKTLVNLMSPRPKTGWLKRYGRAVLPSWTRRDPNASTILSSVSATSSPNAVTFFTNPVCMSRALSEFKIPVYVVASASNACSMRPTV